MISNEGNKINIPYRKILAARMLVNYIKGLDSIPSTLILPEICRLLFLPLTRNQVDYSKVDFSTLTAHKQMTTLNPGIIKVLALYLHDDYSVYKLWKLHLFFKYLTPETQSSLADALTTILNYEPINQENNFSPSQDNILL